MTVTSTKDLICTYFLLSFRFVGNQRLVMEFGGIKKEEKIYYTPILGLKIKPQTKVKKKLVMLTYVKNGDYYYRNNLEVLVSFDERKALQKTVRYIENEYLEPYERLKRHNARLNGISDSFVPKHFTIGRKR